MALVRFMGAGRARWQSAARAAVDRLAVDGKIGLSTGLAAEVAPWRRPGYPGDEAREP
jgi:hypothetical protein